MRSLLNSRIGKATFKVVATQETLFFKEFSDPYILVKVVDSETDRTRTGTTQLLITSRPIVRPEAVPCSTLSNPSDISCVGHVQVFGEISRTLALETEKKIRALLAEGQMAALVIDMDSWGGSSAEAQSMSALLLHKTMKGIPILFFVRARHSVQPTS